MWLCVGAADGAEGKVVVEGGEAARRDLGVENGTNDAISSLARGGRSTMAGHGVAVDSYRAAPQLGTPSEWIALFFRRGYRSITVSIARYGARCCVLLCKVWCSMMQQWYDEWISGGFSDDVEFGEYDPEAALPVALADLNTLPDGHDVRARLIEILSLRPFFVAL